MWSRALRRPLTGAKLHRKVRFARPYNGQPSPNQDLPHTTYFQQPPQSNRPPRRMLRTTLLATGFFGFGVIVSPWILEYQELQTLGLDNEDEDASGDALHQLTAGLSPQDAEFALEAQLQHKLARTTVGTDMALAQQLIERQKGWAAGVDHVGHFASLPSNTPCEDFATGGQANVYPEREKNWEFYGIFDGHAGPRTAYMLSEVLPSILIDRLYESGCMDRPYVPNDGLIERTIRNAFVFVDDEMLSSAKDDIERPSVDMSYKLMAAGPAFSGSCALVALYDPLNSVLRVANTGDSRAILGRWDSKLEKYVAKPMSYDQTGFNPDEVKRLQDDHPGEDVVDPKTGRVHGIAVSRAFGDARWKWPNEFTQFVHQKLFGPAPRPNGVIKTPPYLTAEPQVIEMQIQKGTHPDFLIMASDGLWDNMSSENAVLCVQQWLDKYKPTECMGTKSKEDAEVYMQKFKKPPFDRSFPDGAIFYDSPGDDDTYYDENDRCLKWRVEPKHFVVEDDHAAAHLVKNALGGRRRNLFCGVMAVQPPLSRNVRDDITVQVVFFGQDVKEDYRKPMGWFKGIMDDTNPSKYPPISTSQ